MKIFIEPKKLDKFKDAIAHANYLHRIDVSPSVLETKGTPRQYALDHNYDLLLTIPPDLKSWKPKLEHKENEVFVFASDIGKARRSFSKDPEKKTKVFSNGAKMERILT